MIPQLVKSSARRLLANCYRAGSFHREAHRGKVLILMYHRVLPEAEARSLLVQPGMYVTPETFILQLRFLKREFDLLSFPDLIGGWDGGSLDRKGRFCLVTFDDGWRDNYIHAFPVLRKLGIPATLFLPTAYIGTRRWFWPERLTRVLRLAGAAGWISLADSFPAARGVIPGPGSSRRSSPELVDAAIERIKEQAEERIEEVVTGLERRWGLEPPADRLCIDWNEAREMSMGGISFGSHSSTHRILTRLPIDQAGEEIEGSMRTLAARGVETVPVFCYPNGGHDSRIRELVSGCGYRAAVTTRFGFEATTGSGDPFAIRRIGVHDDVSSNTALFSFHLSGWRRASGGGP